MNAASRITFAIALAGFAVLAAPSAKAQSEIAPDFFASPDMVPFDQPAPAAGVRSAQAAETPATNVNYAGQVTLAHRVRCNGKTLAAGNYAVAMHSDGKTVELSLHRSGHTVTLHGVAHKDVPSTEAAYLVVERRGNARRLSVIHAGAVQMVFAAEPAYRGAATLEVLPVA